MQAEEIAVPEIDLKKLEPNKLNPRQRFSKAGLDDLAASIRQFGVLEPILVRPVNSHYQVVVGERRYRAAQQAGLDTVPVVIRDYSDEDVMEINLVENVQREDLSAVEKAKLHSILSYSGLPMTCQPIVDGICGVLADAPRLSAIKR